MKYALIGELVDNGRVQTLAVWNGEDFGENFEYDLKGTPCQNVVETNTCSYPKDIQILFPEDKILIDMDAAGYIGAPLRDSDGNINGILAVLDTQPLKNEALNTQVLNVFAARAGAELGRKIAERKQKKLKAQFYHAQKMEAIGNLAGGIAHDFNNILSGIFGYAQLAQTHIHHPERIKEDIEKIVLGTQKAADLVHQILTFSQKSDQEFQPINLYNIVLESIKLIESTLPSTIQIHTELNSKSSILGNRTNINQIVMNLCTNAFHAMRDSGGDLTISLDEVPVEETVDHTGNPVKSGRYLKLNVIDTGYGIPNEKLAKIFEPYFTTKDPDQGTGLGLAVVDGIVKSHGGFIHVDSNPGIGTSFSVYLPKFDKEVMVPNSTKNDTDIQEGSGNVLLVDDEKDILDVTKMYLEERGFSVHEFEDPNSALAAFKTAPDQYDIVITDMTMPRITGDKLSKEMLYIRSDIPIILCTGFSDKFSEKDALKSGIRKYPYKPLEFSELVKIINKILHRN